MRDPFLNPFARHDHDRWAIWEMLVKRDIDAFVAADWAAIQPDFLEPGFTGISGNFQSDPQGFHLAFPTLADYRDRWLSRAQALMADSADGKLVQDLRTSLYQATRLEEIDLTGDAALARKKFDGGLARTDGRFDRINWQTLYICRRHQGRWRITGFLGYLPHIQDQGPA